MSHPAVPGAHLKDLDPDPHRGEEIDFQSPGERAEAEAHKTHRIKWLGLVVGIGLALLVYFLMPGDLAQGARLTAATAVLMGTWWMTEALPLPATALVPLVVFALWGGAMTLGIAGTLFVLTGSWSGVRAWRSARKPAAC